MSIFGKSDDEITSEQTHQVTKYTKEMLTEVQLKEAGRRFNNCIRGLQDHIDFNNDDVQFIGLLKELSIRKVYEDSQLFGI